MILKTNPIRLISKRASGFALDAHTIQSTPSGVNEFGHITFDTQRSELGEALYRLKYKSDESQIDDIADTVCDFLENKFDGLDRIDFIIPVPPSVLSRSFQPVAAVAGKISETLKIPFSQNDLIKNKATPQLKDLSDSEERASILEDAFAVKTNVLENKNVILFDDLFGSGATLRAIVDVLYDQGNVKSVRVITLTHKRRQS